MSVARFIADQRTRYRVPHVVTCMLLGVSEFPDLVKRNFTAAGPNRKWTELIHSIAGLTAEQSRQVAVFFGQQVYRHVRRASLSDPVGVVLLGESDQITQWMDRDLTAEPDQSACALVPGPVVTTNIG